MRRFLLVISLALGILSTPSSADDMPDKGRVDDERRVRPGRLALVGGSAAAFHYIGFKYFDRAWYQGQKTHKIRWIYDWGGDTYVNLDKGGHFMGGAFMAQKLSEAYAWAGFTERTAALLGTTTSWAALLEIEMRDAYFDQWGFSVPDFIANTLGASLPVLHAFFPRTRALQFKWSYHPSNLYLQNRKRSASDLPHVDHLIDDYEGMTFWASLPLPSLLNRKSSAAPPEWLRLAIGYGATGLHGSNAKSRGRFKLYPNLPDAKPEVFLALDYDANYLPGNNRLWRYFKAQLNWLHWPAPAVRIYPSFRLYFLYL